MPIRSWDPFGSRDLFAAMWSTNPLAPMATGIANSYRTLFTTFRRLIVGRTVAFQIDTHDAALTVTELQSDLEILELSVGQFGDIVMAARDVTYREFQFPYLKVTFRNVHLRPGSQPRLTAAPVELELEIPSAALDDLVKARMPWLSLDVGEHGVARIEWTRWPKLGHVEIGADMVGTTLQIRPRILVVRQRRLSLPRWAPRHSVAFPSLWNGALITKIDAIPGGALVSALLPTSSVDMPRRRWEDIVRSLGSSAGVFNIARYARRN